MHGANRLASNSLLEGLVFGALAAETMIAEAPPSTARRGQAAAATPHTAAMPEPATETWIAELRQTMWRYAGLLRDRTGLEVAQRILDELAKSMPQGLYRRAVEARNLHTVAELIVASALARQESRGAHFRNDFPLRGAEPKHSIMRHGQLEFVA